MNFSLYIAKRYIRSKSSQSAVNIINFITFLVVVIGSAALFIVLSAFAGLKTFSLQFSNTFDPDLKAIATTGKFFSLDEADAKKLSEINGIANYSKEIEERVYLSFKEKNHIAYIKGIGENYRNVTGLDSTLYYGNWSDNELSVVAGRGVVNRLGIVVNSRDALKVITLKPGKGSLTREMLSSKSAYNQLSVNVSGVYAIEESLDNKYVIAELQLVQAFLEKDSTQISALGFKLKQNSDEEKVRVAIKSVLGERVIVLNRRELNNTLYRMLNTENMATYLIFTLVLIIALFNVVGAIIMMILDKQQNLKTLYSLGATIKELRRIYFVQGVLVTTLGGLMGVVLGSLLIGSQIAFEWLMITPSLPYPVEYNIMNVLVVLATIIILGLLSSKIASSRISKELVAN